MAANKADEIMQSKPVVLACRQEGATGCAMLRETELLQNDGES